MNDERAPLATKMTTGSNDEPYLKYEISHTGSRLIGEDVMGQEVR